MALITREHSYVDNKPARPSHVNANEVKLFNEINGNLDWDNIKIALVNTANGLVKLDGSAHVPLAQIPATLTGKDADTLDTKHYTDIATEIDADIAIHAAIAAAHHAKTVSSDIDHGSVGGLGDDDHPQYLLKAGGTMVGTLILHGAPTENLHAATKKYVDDEIVAGGFGDMFKSVYDTGENGIVDNAEKLEGSTKAQVQDHTPKSHKLNSHADPDGSVSMNSQKITSLLDPTANQDGATKKYVDDNIFTKNYDAMNQFIFPLTTNDENALNGDGLGDFGYTGTFGVIEVRVKNSVGAANWASLDATIAGLVDCDKKGGMAILSKYVDGGHLDYGFFGIGEYGVKHIGFKLKAADGHVYGTVYDTAESAVDLGAWSSDLKIYRFVIDPGVSVKFYIGDVYKGQVTTNIPTGDIAMFLNWKLVCVLDADLQDHKLSCGGYVYWKDY